jgi:hypothetical protein
MRLAHALLWLPLLAACSEVDPDDGGGGGDTTETLELATVATGLGNPLFITASPGDGTRLFVVEQEGRIRVIRNDTLLPTAFLDITDSVAHGDEQGLLGLAFAPDYATSGTFYVHTTATDGDIRLLRYSVGGSADLADAGSGVEILRFDHPDDNHNGGAIAFGTDGFLYVSSGDGGGSGDPDSTGQDPSDLLGAILRIDVSGDSAGYAIPSSNPFVGDPGFAGELWAYGLRNPWRFSFDRVTHEMWIGDVGQGAWEEVDKLPAGIGGQNLGWSELEGTHCFRPATGCSTAGKMMPVFEYDSNNGRCSVIGGYVYRGAAIDTLAGVYVYSDYCDGIIRFHGAGAPTDLLPTGSQVLSFGEDLAGELYVGLSNGHVARLRAGTP